MKFMMFVVSDAEPDTVPDESDVQVWVDDLDAVGKRTVGDILDPAAAKVVRVREGVRLVSDGPVAGVTDTVWGFDILEALDFDEALDIAARHPMARNGQLELRPFPDSGADASPKEG